MNRIRAADSDELEGEFPGPRPRRFPAPSSLARAVLSRSAQETRKRDGRLTEAEAAHPLVWCLLHARRRAAASAGSSESAWHRTPDAALPGAVPPKGPHRPGPESPAMRLKAGPCGVPGVDHPPIGEPGPTRPQLRVPPVPSRLARRRTACAVSVRPAQAGTA